MSRNTRFMTGGLATLAVASAFTLAGPTTSASALSDDRGCGQPAVDAVYDTVVHEPLFRTVPAITHDEWTWARDVEVPEFEFSKVVSPARVEVDWARSIAGPTEWLYSRTVIDTAAVPAVPGTPEVGHTETVEITPAVTEVFAEYEHQVTGKLRWERDTWGAQNGAGNGWEKTGLSETRVIEPAVTGEEWVVDVPATPGTPELPEVSHVEWQWATSAPGPDWDEPQSSRPGTSSVEEQTTDGAAPAGEGWESVSTRSFGAEVDVLWSFTAPEGYDPTGATRTAGTTHEQTEAKSATAPEGDGWTAIEDSKETITDQSELVEIVLPGSIETVLVSPALPATEPCEDAIISDGGPLDEGTETQPPAAETGAEVAGPQAAPEAAQTSAPAATVLPNTGGTPGWMAPAGLATMIAGAILVGASRRRGHLI